VIVIGQGVVEWVAKRAACSTHNAQGIGLQRGGNLIAGVVYEDFNGANVFCHIAAEGSHWLTRKYLWTIFDYPFNQLKVKRITVPVAASNGRSKAFCATLGIHARSKPPRRAPDWRFTRLSNVS